MGLSPNDLRQVIVLQNATDDDLKLIIQNSLVRSIEEGGFFFFQGDSADHIYVLTHGQVKLMQASPGGQQVNLRTIYPWEMFGALGAVHGAEARYPATAETLEDSLALAIKAVFFKEIMQTRPYLSAGLMQLMTSYIQEIQSRYRELATERVEQRIARALLRLTSQSGQKANEGIDLTFSRQDLAEMSGTTLYTVSRVLAKWERQDLIEARREHVRVLIPHGLVKIAEGLEK